MRPQRFPFRSVPAVVMAVVGSVAILGLVGHGSATPDGEGREAVVSAQDRAIALGHLLDSSRPIEVIDQGLLIAEKLRQRYGIDTGDPYADRAEAARRARTELLESLRFEDEEIGAMAAALGYSLEDCGNYCGNVRRLARLELQKAALHEFAEHTIGP